MIADSAADILAQFLCDQGLVCHAEQPVAGLPLVITSSMPDRGDNLIAIKDTTALKEGRYMRTGENVLKYSCILTFRTGDYRRGAGIASAINNTMERSGLVSTLVSVYDNQYQIQNIKLVMPFTFIGEEKNGRQLFTMDVRLTIVYVGASFFLPHRQGVPFYGEEGDCFWLRPRRGVLDDPFFPFLHARQPFFDDGSTPLLPSRRSVPPA